MTGYVWNLVRWLSEPKDQETPDQGNLGTTEKEEEVKEYKPIVKVSLAVIQAYILSG